jgi:membrane-anchored mycosin MYCP
MIRRSGAARRGLALMTAGLLAGGMLALAVPAASLGAPARVPMAASDECTAATRIDQPVPALSELQSEAAWAITRGAGVTVAVVDSGVAANPHLTGAVVGGVNLVPDGTDPQGRTDTFGHGTAIAGQIAARTIEDSGVEGLAPEATILPVRVFAGTSDQQIEAGFGPNIARMAEGIRYAADQGAQVINVSMSTVGADGGLASAVAYATARGSLVIGSAGNRDASLAVEKGGDEAVPDGPRYPAGFPEAVGVGATDAAGVVTDASVHGPHVALAAPGQLIPTTSAAGGDCVYAPENPATSYAAGYVSAAAALVVAAYPDEGPAQWRYRLEASAVRPDPDERSDEAGWGVVQPYDAIMLVPGTGIRGPVSPFAPEVEVAPPVVADDVVEVVDDPGADAAAIALGVLIAVGALVVLAALGALGVYVSRRAERPARRPVSHSGGLYRDAAPVEGRAASSPDAAPAARSGARASAR